VELVYTIDLKSISLMIAGSNPAKDILSSFPIVKGLLKQNINGFYNSMVECLTVNQKMWVQILLKTQYLKKE
jgi:hypothetical protein